MCEFCRRLKKTPIVKSDGLKVSLSMKYNRTLGWCIAIENEKTEETTYKKINYCPMCRQKVR